MSIIGQSNPFPLGKGQPLWNGRGRVMGWEVVGGVLSSIKNAILLVRWTGLAFSAASFLKNYASDAADPPPEWC